MILLSILMIPLAKLNTEIDLISPLDNKYFQTFPDIGDGYSLFLNDLNLYLSERLGGRFRLIKYYQIANDRLFSYLDHPNYEYGKNKYIFGKTARSLEDFEFLDLFTDYILEIQDYCEKRNIPFIYLLNPSKTTVYEDYLPEGYHYNNRRLEILQQFLQEKAINHVDNTPYFIELSKAEQIYNIKDDPGHWNYLGAYYGVNHLLEKMHQMDTRISTNEIHDFNVSTTIAKTLYNSEFPINEIVPSISEKNTSFSNIDPGLVDEIELDDNYRGYIRIQSNANNDINLLVFHGSYFNGFGYPFLARAVHTYQDIHNYQNLLNFDYYFNIFQPNFVVITTAEYATTSNYFSIEKLLTKTLNPLLIESDFAPADTTISLSRINSGLYISKLFISLPDDIDYGYFLSGDQVFDLIKEETEEEWSVSTLKENMNLENSKIYLVTSKGDKVVYDLDY